MSMSRSIAAPGVICLMAVLALGCMSSVPGSEVTSTWIVQAKDTATARARVAAVHAEAGRDLPIIRATTARLTPRQLARLRADSAVRLHADRSVHSAGLLSWLDRKLKDALNSINGTVADSIVGSTTATTTRVAAPVLAAPLTRTVTTPLVGALGGNAPLQDGRGVAALGLVYETNYPWLIGADGLHDRGINGRGVTIAVLDSGLWQDTTQNYGGRILATRDVTNGGRGPVSSDPYGHGTHVTSIAAGGAVTLTGRYQGVAPAADLVIVRAFDRQGAGRYSDIIAGLDWVVANRVRYNIRVLNLSFGAAPQSFYWDDPLNQAVMSAWRAGIVVVASSGNDGPSPMTVNVPGNVPYVITVGALTDNYTPHDASDDRLASFSSAGPTYEGFVKPELVAPGGHIAASMSSSSYLPNIDPGSMHLGQQLFTMSGTSQAAAVTSGVVALMLQRDPWLSPDEVKCRLILSARPAVKQDNRLAYSVFQQGAGLINALMAMSAPTRRCANVGLDIDADLAGTRHFGGPANRNADGDYYIMDMDGRWGTESGMDGGTWDSTYNQDGYNWSSGYSWSDGHAWDNGYPWSKNRSFHGSSAWSDGYIWSRNVSWWQMQGSPATGATPASIAPWVPNE